MANPTVGEVLAVLRQSFKAVDLRAVVVALGDQRGWQNVFTVIRFSAKTAGEISAEHERLKRLYELPSEVLNKLLGKEHNIEPYKGMNIELSAYPIDQFKQLVGRLREGHVTASNRAFRVSDRDLAIDLMREEMYLRMNLEYEDIGNHWPVYYWGCGEQRTDFEGFGDEQGDRPWLGGHDLDKQSRGFGFANFQELLERITGESFRRGSGHAFEIFAPVYARITSVTPLTDAINVTGHFHRALGELVVECSLYERAQWERAVGRSLGKARVGAQTNGQELAPFSTEFKLEEPPETGRVRVSLIKQAATRVDLHEEQSPLRSGVLAFRAFTSFVPEEDITDYLRCLTSGTNVEACSMYRKFTPRDNSKKKDELFEHVVTYLLGLFQLNPVLLSNPKYDVIEGGLQAGSADIVASAPDGDPILVSCTMAMPDARKRNMLLAARTAIANRVRVPLEAIRVMLVTGKPSVSPSDTELVELAAADLERVWAMCRQGNLSEARRLLGLQ